MNLTAAAKPIVIVGLGQMGGVFARGFLAAGEPVYPITSEMSMADSVDRIPEPVFVLLAVPEEVLPEILGQVPDQWRDRLGLLQNELLPVVWETAAIVQPTAMAVWFEKKQGRGVHVFQPTQIYGPHAALVKRGLNAVDIPCEVLPDEDALLIELIKKNLYVLTINIAGLVVGGTTGQLWAEHQPLAVGIAHDILDILERRTRFALDRPELIAFLEHILTAAPDHKCRGRVAEDRLVRMLRLASELGLNPQTLSDISD